MVVLVLIVSAKIDCIIVEFVLRDNFKNYVFTHIRVLFSAFSFSLNEIFCCFLVAFSTEGTTTRCQDHDEKNSLPR
jgi:hypothetical protein